MIITRFKSLLNIMRKLRFFYYLYINRLILTINDVKYGRNLKIYNRFYITKHKNAELTIGNDFVFTSGESFNPLCRNIRGAIYLPEESSKLFIGNNVGISSACIWAKESITIKDNVKIGGDCILMDTDAHNLDYQIRASNLIDSQGRAIDSTTANSKPIVVENDVLIGTRCIILKGVTIGEKSIIGSGSVVTKSIPANCIAAGNPCKVIKTL